MRSNDLSALGLLGIAGLHVGWAAGASFGFAGRTDLLAPGSTSAGFRSRDRRIYAPVCAALAVTALPACRL